MFSQLGKTGKANHIKSIYLKLQFFLFFIVEYLTDESLNEAPSEDLIILNRAAKKMTPENRKKLLDIARVMFKEDFDD